MGVCSSFLESRRLLKEACVKRAIFRFTDTVNAVCVKVYDGDTIHVLRKYGKEYIKLSVRIWGIDCPEIRTTTGEKTSQTGSYEARDFLAALLLNKIVKLECKGNDKYGRTLAKIEINGMDVSKLMIEKGYACEYYGGQKGDTFQCAK
jgi:micrococcal nuclease